MAGTVQNLVESDSCAATKSCASLTHDCFALRRARIPEPLMTVIHQNEPAHTPHPIDMLERAVEENGWAFERAGRDELNLSIAGRWSDHHFSFSWHEDLQSLHLSSAFDMRITGDTRRSSVADLLM